MTPFWVTVQGEWKWKEKGNERGDIPEMYSWLLTFYDGGKSKTIGTSRKK